MASIRKAKKLGTYVPPRKLTIQEKEIYQRTQKIVNKVNRRFENLAKSGYLETYSGKKLTNRLNKYAMSSIKRSRKGKNKILLGIKLNKNLTTTQLLAIQRASRQFLRSKTSTVKGIKSVKDATIKSLKITMSDEEDEKSLDEATEMYNMLDDEDFKSISKLENVGASSLWALLDDAKERNMDQNQFIDFIEANISANDLNLREKAINLYNKYVL